MRDWFDLWPKTKQWVESQKEDAGGSEKLVILLTNRNLIAVEERSGPECGNFSAISPVISTEEQIAMHNDETCIAIYF